MLNKIRWRENERKSDVRERYYILLYTNISRIQDVSWMMIQQCDELYEKNKLKIYNKIIFILCTF